MKTMKRLAVLMLALCLLMGVLPQTTLVANAASASTYVQNTTIRTRLDAIFDSYEPGKAFFTKNGKACSCHTNSDFSCIDATDTRCNCLRKPTINGNKVDLYGSQCIAYVRYCQEMLFGCNDKTDSKEFTKLTGSSSLTAAKTKTWFTNNKSKLHTGTHIRVYGSGHSICLLNVDYTNGTIQFLECNWFDQSSNTGNWCRVNPIRSYSWSKFASTYGSIDYAYVYTNYRTEFPDTPILSIKYHANGGTIPNSGITGYTYKVTESVGINMRTGAGTSYNKIKTLSQGTTFNVNIGDTKTADGYTWGKTTVGGDTGWVVVSQYVSKTATLRATTHYLSSSLVYKTSSSAVRVTNMTYGVSVDTGLCNDTTFGLIREGYKFVGWSLSAEGGTIIDQDQAIKPEEIVPDLKNGSKTVTVYAIWEESRPANITLAFNANGGIGAMDSKSVTKGDSVYLPESQFTKEGHSFIGWTIQRNDGLWYTSTNTWGTESAIATQSYAKKVFASGDAITLDSSFVTVSGDHSYTLYAQWRNDSIQSIQIASIGKDNVYYVGDALNTGSISLMVGYVDGSYETVTEGFTCSPTTLSKEGKETITVTYGPLTTTYTVQVTKAKTSKANGTGKSDSKGYLLPSTSAGTIAGQGVWKDDSVQVLCKDGNFYLTFIPWGATSASTSNRVLLYLPTSAVTVSGSIPSASDYYSLNPTGQNNATVNSKVYVYHRTDGGATPVTYGDTAYTKMGPLAVGTRVKILFEMDGYYCVQTSSYTGFIAKSAITLDNVLCGIYVGAPTTDFCLTAEKGKVIDTSTLTIAGIYSDGSNQTITDYEIELPDTASIGLKYATIRYGGFAAFVPVRITAPLITDSEGNEIGNFISLTDALAAAKEGQTLLLQADIVDTDVVLSSGVNLDLNGHTLIADSVLTYSSGAIIDTSENVSGLLKINDADGNMLSQDNAQLPVYDDAAGGYRFFAMDVQPCAVTGNNKYWFKVKAEKFAPLYELIQSDADVQIQVKMTWDGQTEDTYAAADLSFTKAWANSYNANEDIYITVSVADAEGLENFKLIPIVTSSGVEIPGEEM